ncbi:hypothetical protein [Aquimarina sp. 2201CG5-10]|uniref:hypothetical protein n=1 Tax=Aquimarina callyspongiae TaxID=3098150 RepID=UPI002AB49A6B|nr:hypothetical protein [Aquimarina sp. 2201CG5-10]MDY8136624.1 hypothetical protein [Aquimarina sp. 2201CG5-10]
MSDKSITIPQAKPVLELHACMGLNACKGHGWSGENNCAGTGDCATNRHPCHTLNDCKGQGGCGLFGSDSEVCHPGENDCSFQGSCGTPILASRYITQGPNKGQSVWQLARKLFEERMKKANRTVGPPPEGQEYGPTTEFVAKRGGGSSCGQSGDRYCSYAFDEKSREEERKQRREEFMKKSAKELPQTIKNCDCD